MNTVITQVTQGIIQRSQQSRTLYLERLTRAHTAGVKRKVLGCSNLAHGFAACPHTIKETLKDSITPNIAIISAYNDMLSAHEPFKRFPDIIKQSLADIGVSSQFAGGVPAMCDGVTQSQPGMELSLFSRDIIAQSTAIALSHNMFDGALYLGVCDKIVPGLLIGALTFGHLPAVFIPGGPMPSGISNSEKAKTRQEFAIGKASKKELLESEAKSYHSPGTCTFYGTANSNQMLMEIMGLHLPGSSFVEANTILRDKLTSQSAKQITTLIDIQSSSLGVGHMLNEKSFVNAIIGLLVTGGSTNHTIHLIAMARAAGIIISWQDFHELSQVIPLLTKLYPNGSADVNDFHRLGGMPIIIQELLQNGLLHDEVQTIMGKGLAAHYTKLPILQNGALMWSKPPSKKNNAIIATVDTPFSESGGMIIATGNIGQGVIKTSALTSDKYFIEEQAEVFDTQEEMQIAYKQKKLNKNFIAVIRYQGPKANGMPELHGLMPILGVLQDEGYKVGIVTDGRMSGASGKVPAVIHMSPEAYIGGTLAKIKNGDMLRIDINNAQLEVLVSNAELQKREVQDIDLSANNYLMGRELFFHHRAAVSSADTGATIFNI